MKNKPEIPESIDDFHSIPHSRSNTEIYQSFLLAKKLSQEISKKFRPESQYEKYRFFKEINSSNDESKVLFRKKYDASGVLSALWMSKVKEAAFFSFAHRKLKNFTGLNKEQMREIAYLSADEKNLKNMQDILADLGIILIYQAAIPGMKLDGAVYTVNGATPVIALSLRYPRLDMFWFTLMHELAHVALHHDQLSEPILDDFDESSEQITELQADRLAADCFIARSEWRSCEALYDQKDDLVIKFANRMCIHPSIVAGRIRKELNKHTVFSEIINSVNIRKVLLND